MAVIGELIVPSSPYDMDSPEVMPHSVWLTAGGAHFHRTKCCQALDSGQGRAKRKGFTPHKREHVSLQKACSKDAKPCAHCFPSDVNADSDPCSVKVNGKWRDGFAGIRQQIDGIWHYRVSYRTSRGGRAITEVTENEVIFSRELVT